MNSFNLDPNLSNSERVLLALKEARIKLENVAQEKRERVAIIGMAGRFPGAETVEQFWQNLCNGVNSIQFPSQAPSSTPDSSKPNNYVNAYSSLENIAGFDATFFGYSPREAELLDPQHRVFLECAWSALENAGYDADRYEGAIGIYAGAALNSYLINLHAHPHLRQSIDRVQAVVSNVMGLMTTRVSYKLNLRGPSCGIQTGCSTSLVAVHLAAQSLLNRDCDLALAGGVAIDASEQTGYFYQNDGVMSPDGYCRAFDAEAKGTVFGNGVGIVVLKRLSEAIADRDCIYAVIKGSAINNDGAQKVGLTAPSVTGQAAVITAALAKAEIEPETIQYIETHGTGTALGDPIEIAALTKAFRQHTPSQQFCAIGSVKPNVGHLDAAAGVTGLIKTALAMKHQQIPPSLNFQTPNPQIDFAHSPFYVNTKLTDWPNSIRRAAVSSFGMGGTNAHVILESIPASTTTAARPWQLLLLSAKTTTALNTSTAQLAEHLRQYPSLDLADIAYTLQVGRNPLEHRRMLVCQTVKEAIEKLSLAESQSHVSDTPNSIQKNITFLFPGQGSQYANMGRELYNRESIFRTEIDRCCTLLKPRLNLDLRDILYSDIPNSSLTQTAIAQPTLFVLEYALAQLWMSWGIQPAALIGHSIGEYVAACLAGVFSLEDALKLVAVRGQLMQSCPEGAMLSVRLSEAEVSAFLTPDLTLAAVNAPQLCVLSGSEEAIAPLEQRLNEKNIVCRRLQTSHAFHSPSMQPIVEAFVTQVSQVQLHPPKLPLISNVTGAWMTAAQATDPVYWGQQLRQTVQFATGLDTVLQKTSPILLEVGAGRTLSTFAKSIGGLTFASLRHPQEQASDVAFLLNTLGQLWLAGIEINWTEFYAAEKRQRVPLPTYPFEHQRYWVDLPSLDLPSSDFSSPDLLSSEQEPSLSKQSNISSWFYIPSWKRQPIVSTHLISEQCWLILSDNRDIGKLLIQKLVKSNHKAVLVFGGDRFSQTGDRYTINPACPDDYSKLILSLQERHLTPQQIVHLWSLSESPLSAPIQAQEISFYSLIALVQALKDADPLHLTVITQSLHNITGTETHQPQQALVLGACKVIPQEYSHLQCTCIDVEIADPSSLQFNRCIDQIGQELMAIAPERSMTYPVIAYRDRHRWVQTYEPLPLDSVSSPLRQGGLYLIAGDLVEGLGLIFAQSLAETLQARLVVIGRAGLPERAAWEQWLVTHGQSDPVSRCLRTLQAIEVRAELHFFSADLTDAAALEAILQVCKPLGQIHGVFHADRMGDRSSCLIQAIDQAEMERQFQSKVRGLLTLDTVLQGKVSDFYLLQSSLSTAVGGVGFAAYAAANCFMDAYAQQPADVPRISVNWDACRLDELTSSATGQALMDLAMTPSEVWEVTQRILSRPDLAQVIVSPADLPARIQQSLQQLFQKPAHASLTQYERPTLSTAFVAPRNAIEQAVADTMAELLGIEQIGIYDNFFELGGHSLLAIQAVSRLRENFQVELPMRDFLFESPTVAGIAKIIAENQSKNANQQAVVDLLEQIEQMDMEPIKAQEQTHGL